MNQRKITIIGLAVALALVTTLLFIGGVLAADDANLPYTINTFDQCRNGKGGTGPCVWSNGAINGSNSKYSEGDATVQRLYLTGVPAGTQVVEIQYQTTKSGKHAYDYLVTYDYSENYVGQSELCNGLASGCTSWSSATFSIPLDPNVSGAGVTQKSGVFTIFNGTITGVSGYTLDALYTGDSQTTIVVSFTSTTDQVLIVWGGHIASQGDWGSGNSASAINGAPYHQIVYGHDNQLMSSAITPLSQLTIIKDTIPDHTRVFTYTSVTDSITPLQPDPFYLQDDGDSSTDPNSITFKDLEGGTYTITEQIAPGTSWLLVEVLCSGVKPSTGGTFTPSYTYNLLAKTLSLNLQLDQNVTCTFTNQAGGTAIALSSVSAKRVAKSSAVGVVGLIGLVILAGGVFYRSRTKALITK